jgi:ribosomal protein S18 acetylase RimI-like enzyme
VSANADDGANSAAAVRIRRARPDAPGDVEFLRAQAPRVAEGAPPWYTAAAIASVAADAIIGVLQGQREGEVIMIAEDETGDRLGFVYVLITPDPLSNAAQAHISDIVVAPQAEGRRVGQQLLATAEAWAMTRDVAALTLHVFPDNTRARDLYARQGYALEWLRLRKPLRR